MRHESQKQNVIEEGREKGDEPDESARGRARGRCLSLQSMDFVREDDAHFLIGEFFEKRRRDRNRGDCP